MRIGMVAYAYYEGNGRIEQYAKALVERGDTVEVFALRRGDAPEYEKLDGVHVFRLQTRKVQGERFYTYVFQVITFLFRSFYGLAKNHLKNRYDLIHVHSVPDFLVFSALVPKLLGSSVILDIHDILPEFYISKFRTSERSLIFKLLVMVEKISIAFSDFVIVANLIWRERLLQRSAAPEKVMAIGNYPDSRVFFPRPRTRFDERFVLMYPGSLNWHQGLDIAIRAFAKVVQSAPQAEFRIYGEGPERDNLGRLARENGLQEKVLFSDFLPVSEVAELMANADLAVVPKRASSRFGTEAASTKIMEFMSVGIPVVVSKTKIDTLYHTDATVRFFESDSPEELAKVILDLYANPELRQKLTANALDYVARNNWQSKKVEYLAVVDRLAKKNQKREVASDQKT